MQIFVQIEQKNLPDLQIEKKWGLSKKATRLRGRAAKINPLFISIIYIYIIFIYNIFYNFTV